MKEYFKYLYVYFKEAFVVTQTKYSRRGNLLNVTENELRNIKIKGHRTADENNKIFLANTSWKMTLIKL